MEIKKLLFVILVISITSITQAQITPFEPIVFTDITPVWQHVSIDSTLIDSTHDGMQQLSYINDRPFPYLINDNDLYFVTNTSVKVNTALDGGLVEKLDIRTGKLKWVKYYDLRNNTKQEYVESIYLNSDGNINVITDRRINDINKNWLSTSWGDTSLLCIREYDINTGELLKHNFPDSKDYLSKRIRNSDQNRTILYPINNDKFIYLEYSPGKYIRNILDDNGHLLNEPISHKVTFDKYYNSDSLYINTRFKMQKINRDTLVGFDYLSKIDRNAISGYERQAKITLYNNDLQEFQVFNIDSFLPKRIDLMILEANKKFMYVYGRFQKHFF